MRSAPELARLLAIALPLSVNSRVRLSWSDRYATVQLTAARGTRTSTRNSVILPRRPKRTRRAGLEAAPFSLPAAPPSTLSFIARLLQTRFAPLIGSSHLDRRRPVHDRHPPVALHPREVHAVQALVALGGERHGRPDAHVEGAKRLEGLAEGRTTRIGAGTLEGFRDHPRVHVALETDEAVLLRHVAGVADSLRHRGVVLVHQGAIFDHSRQPGVVVARHHLGIDEAARVVSRSEE